jgi:hypothetical protein
MEGTGEQGTREGVSLDGCYFRFPYRSDNQKTLYINASRG